MGLVFFFSQFLGLFLTSAHFILWPYSIGVKVLVFVTVLIRILNGRNIAMVISCFIVVVMRVFRCSVAQVIVPSRRVAISKLVLVRVIEDGRVSEELCD